MENVVGQPQTVQVPNYSGVNIQIFNPTVAAPGATVPAANVNSTNYATSPAAPSYPPNYYMQNIAQSAQAGQVAAAPAKTKPVAAKKMEKRDVVVLTDDYIKNVENYLNNQNKDVRLMGAKEVLARLQEDDSRKKDPALTALANKMLQDPYQPVRLMAMGALDSRILTGDNLSVKLLQNMQQQKSVYGEDALSASKILLKMSGKTVQKEFEVKDKPKAAAKPKAKANDNKKSEKK